MIKIGDFSRISQLSVKTLRYYADLGLLKPVEVDPFTGYRYYAFEQLPRLNRILVLKDLGFSLEQIRDLLEKNLPAAEIKGMLSLKQIELQAHLREENERLRRIENRLKQIEQEDSMPDYEVVIKKVEPLLVAGVRDIIPAYPEQGPLWEKLGRYEESVGAVIKGACLTLYYADEPEIDAEVCEPLARPHAPSGAIQVHELPAVENMATLIHRGPFSRLGDAYAAMLRWIEANHYRTVGPTREVYLNPPAVDGNQQDDDTVTEIQFPVEKIAG